MAKPGGLTHMFAELSSLDELGSLVGRSARLKYTCLSVSRKYLALGSNSGGAYIFSRDTLKYLQVVYGDTEANHVVVVSLAPSDQHVALALSTGHIAIYELNIDRRTKPDRVRNIQDHAGSTVTALAWDAASSRVFAGDSIGKISIISISTNKSKNLFTSPSEVIAYVESSVYQLEWLRDRLLVSTLTHTHLFDTTKQNYSTIGTKSRDGEFGACFFVEPSSKYTVIYCGRPGSRMWEVDFEGKVMNTHQFKQLLAVPPIPAVKLGSETFDFQGTPQPGQSVNFYRMFHISQFIVTWSNRGLYLFDPINVKVMLWSQSYRGIKDISVYNNDVYLFLEDSTVHRLTLLPIYQLFTVLSSKQLWSLSSSILIAAEQMGMRHAVMKRVKKDHLQSILAGLKSQGKNDIVERLMATMEDISEGSIESAEWCDDFMDSAEVKGHTYLPSGMVVVSEGVQVRRAWEKTDVRMKIPENLETSETAESTSVYRTSSLDKEVEFQTDNGQMNNSESSELNNEDKQRENDPYEQIENNDIFSQEKTDKNIRVLPLSKIVSNYVVDLSASDSLNNNNKAYVHSLHLDDKLTSENSETKLKDDLLTVFSDSAQNNDTQPSAQIHSQNGNISNNQTNGHRHSEDDDLDLSAVDESPLIINIQTAQSEVDRLSPKHDVTSSPSGSTDLQFPDDIFSDSDDFSELNEGNMEKLVPFDEEVVVPYTSQYSTVLSPSGNDITQNASLGNIFYNLDEDHAELETDKSYFNVFIGSDDVDIEDSHVAESISSQKMEFLHFTQEVEETTLVASAFYADTGRSEVDLSVAGSEQESTKEVIDPGILHESSKAIGETDVEPALNSWSDDTINKMASLSREDLAKMSSSYPGKKFSTQRFLHSENSDIAQPLKVAKRKKKKQDNTVPSASADVNSSGTHKARTLKTALSGGDEYDNQFSQGTDLEMDTISILTISSIEEESSVATSDSLSAAGDLDARDQPTVRTLSPTLSLSPPDVIGKMSSRKSSVSTSYEDRKEEVIPPLIERLAAAHGTVSFDDMAVGHHTSRSSSPLSGSGEHFHLAGSPRASLSAFKDGLSLKLKTKTKSVIKTFKEKGLLTKSSSSPMLAALSSQQLEKPLKDGINHQLQDLEQSDEMSSVDELSRIKLMAAAVVNTKFLYFSAQDIQKRLKNSSVILKPGELHRLLNEWAAELISAMCRYHEALLKRANEMQLKDRPLQTSKLEAGSNSKEESSRLQNLLDMNEKDTITQPSNDITYESSNTVASDNSKFSPLGQKSTLIETVSSEINSAAQENHMPEYWTSITHCQDPFLFLPKQLDLVRMLTTMCFVCGAYGDVLRRFHFTKEPHYRALVRAVLPQSLCSLFSPACDCLMSLLPDSHVASSESGHQLNSERNISTESIVKNAQGSSSNLSNENSAEGRTVNNRSVFEEHNEDNSAAVSRTRVNSETEDQNVNSAVCDKRSQKCSCKYASSSWSENEQFKHDLSLALFTRLFFFALDYEKVKRALDSQTSKVFIAWTSLVLCSREMGKGDIVSSILADRQINSAIDYMRSGILPQQSAQLGHVFNLFQMAPSGASELCGEIYKAITPVDLLQLSCLCSKPASVFLLRYFKQAMVHLPIVMRPAVFKQLINHRDVRFLLLEALLQPQSANPSAESVKSLVTQLKSILPFNWLEEVLSQITTEEERDRTVHLCARAGYPAICIKLLTQVDQWQKLLRLIVDLNNISLLKGRHGEDSYIPRNEQEWRFLLSYFQDKWAAQSSALGSCKDISEDESRAYEAQNSKKQPDLDAKLPVHGTKRFRTNHISTGKEAELPNAQMAGSDIQETKGVSVCYESFTPESNQGDYKQDNSITWNSLGYLLLKHVGGATAIDLIMEHLHDPVVAKNCLTAEFLRACFVDFSIKMEQNLVTHDILEKMSVYMWTKIPDYLPPSVFQAIRAERRLTQRGEGEDVTLQGVFSQVKALESKDLMSEHLGSQWGQEVNISSSCLCCNLPLKSVMSLSIQGVIIFPCGHVFHRCCVPSSVCPVIH